jgi:two-component system, OmpR family, phosphate regulon response regulator PhoB
MSAYNIFIVDDDPQMCAVMSAWLTMAGHTVESDTAGSTALPRIATLEPDAVLVDLMMSEVDGLEMISELRAKKSGANAAIIMVSARTDELWFDKARKAGADDYLTKPLEQASFVEKIESTIAAKLA